MENPSNPVKWKLVIAMVVLFVVVAAVRLFM